MKRKTAYRPHRPISFARALLAFYHIEGWLKNVDLSLQRLTLWPMR
jgi:hypothetical protein